MTLNSRLALSAPLPAGLGLCLLLYPMLLLTVKGGMNAVFFLACILSIIWIYRQAHLIQPKFDRITSVYAMAMASGILAVLFSQLYHGDFVLRTFDAPSRLLLAILIFLALRGIDPRTFVPLQFGFPLGAIASACVALASGEARAAAPFIDTIHFGNLALLLGLLSILSIRWSHRDANWLVALKVIGFAAGIYVSIQSGQRGGWIAIPFIFLLGVLLLDIQHKARWFLFSSFLLALSMAAAYFFIPIVHVRIDYMYSDVVNVWHGRQLASSVGVRVQHMQAAWQLFLQNPLFGIGSANVVYAMIPFEQSGLLTKRAALGAYGELHSDIFSSMARFGLFGLLSTLSFYLVPLFIFVRALPSRSAFHRKAAVMGICFIAAFFVFGLTVENFNLKMVAAFYAMTVAVLLAAATNLLIVNTKS